MKKNYDPSIVCIGGGTGLSTMLRGLKKYTPYITAIVSVTDDGGGSGVLRRELGMLPPGDIRNCIQALADDDMLMTKLLSYRFTDGSLSGQSFGNLFIAAMNGVSGSFDEAVSKVSEVLAITGRVLPVTNEDTVLEAILEDGTVVTGESSVGAIRLTHDCRIKGVRLSPENPAPLKDSIDAINDADVIVLGPGSLYTSVMPNLLVSGVSDAIRNSKAVKIYICNVMTQPGETEGYTVSDHIRALVEHAGVNIVDYCIVNSMAATEELLQKYAAQRAQPVEYIKGEEMFGIKPIFADLSSEGKSLFRHSPEKLASEIMQLYHEIKSGER